MPIEAAFAMARFSRGVHPRDWKFTSVCDLDGASWRNSDQVTVKDAALVSTDFNFAPLEMRLPVLELCTKLSPQVSLFHIEEGVPIGMSHGTAREDFLPVARLGLRAADYSSCKGSSGGPVFNHAGQCTGALIQAWVRARICLFQGLCWNSFCAFVRASRSTVCQPR